jgi:serine/threonine-protein kinase TTK/MPS1
VWSLGCILFAMVYGKTPFEGVKNLIARLRAISDPAFQIEFKPIPNPYLLDVLQVGLRRPRAGGFAAGGGLGLRGWG